MLETLVALLTTVLLAAPTGQSVDTTVTFHREGDEVTVQNRVLVDDGWQGGGGTVIYCNTPTRDAICEATQDQPDVIVHHSRTKGEDGNWHVRREVRAGDVSWTGSSTINCATLTFGGLCTALDTIDTIGQ